MATSEEEVEDDSSERILKQPHGCNGVGVYGEVEDDSSERILKLFLRRRFGHGENRSGRRFFRENTETVLSEDERKRKYEVEDDSSERILKQMMHPLLLKADLGSGRRFFRENTETPGRRSASAACPGSGRRFFRENTETPPAHAHADNNPSKWKTILQREY